MYYIVVNNNDMAVSWENGARRELGHSSSTSESGYPLGERFDRSRTERRYARTEETGEVGRGISTAATS